MFLTCRGRVDQGRTWTERLLWEMPCSCAPPSLGRSAPFYILGFTSPTAATKSPQQRISAPVRGLYRRSCLRSMRRKSRKRRIRRLRCRRWAARGCRCSLGPSLRNGPQEPRLAGSGACSLAVFDTQGDKVCRKDSCKPVFLICAHNCIKFVVLECDGPFFTCFWRGVVCLNSPYEHAN